MPVIWITKCGGVGGIDRNTEKELMKKLHRLQEDFKWIWENRRALAVEYDNKYVAVIDKEVLYSGVNVYNLLTQIKADGKDVDAFAIDFVSKDPPRYLLELHARK